MIEAPPGRYAILRARPGDVPRLAAIELAAATLLQRHAPAAVLRAVTEVERLRAAQRQGRLWVAREEETPVGFAHVELLEADVAHLTELDVHPEHGRRGLGRRLVRAVGAWAAATGYHAVTLTTFRDVPWNAPFYARLGFVEIPPAELSPALDAVLRHEALAGIDRARRVAMRWPVPAPSGA